MRLVWRTLKCVQAHECKPNEIDAIAACLPQSVVQYVRLWNFSRTEADDCAGCHQAEIRAARDHQAIADEIPRSEKCDTGWMEATKPGHRIPTAARERDW